MNLNEKVIDNLKVQFSFIPLFVLVYFTTPEYKVLIVKLLICYSFSVLFMNKFEKYLDNQFATSDNTQSKKHLAEYVLRFLSALIVFLIIELMIQYNSVTFFILISMMFMYLYTVHKSFQYKKQIA